jgi:hypothetical protein
VNSLLLMLIVVASGIHNACEPSAALSWLAPWHDMGLFGFVFMPVCSHNWTVYLMSPVSRIVFYGIVILY